MVCGRVVNHPQGVGGNPVFLKGPDEAVSHVGAQHPGVAWGIGPGAAPT